MPILIWFFRMELFFKFKLTDTSDPFRGLLSYTPHGVCFMFTNVHLSLFLFAENMWGSYVGIEMAQPLPHYFLAFLGGYGHLDRHQQDYDTSVSSRLWRIFNKSNRSEVAYKKRRKSRSPWIPIAPDLHEPEVEKRFVISFPPKYKARSPFGRSTRPTPYMETREIVFLKDC